MFRDFHLKKCVEIIEATGILLALASGMAFNLKHHNFGIWLGVAAGCLILIGLGIWLTEENEPNLDAIINIQPNPQTSTGFFDDTKFVITNNSQNPIYNVTYSGEYWDGQGEGKNKVINCFNCGNPEPKLNPSRSMSAAISIPVVVDKDGNLISPSDLKYPFCQFWVQFTLSEKSTDFVKVGSRFWGEKNKDGIYIWNAAGDAQELKAGEDLPYLDR